MLEGSLVTWKRSSSRAGRRSAGVAKNPLRSSTALQVRRLGCLGLKGSRGDNQEVGKSRELPDIP